ncbi:hypothetical protein N9W00_01655 [Arcobacteraceae bacterium]|nr:hypothetical protein [Arcobacteraceae bacterium]
MVLFTFYTAGGLLIISILFFLVSDIEINSPLVSSLGIIISAFIASFSLKESINNTNRIEKENANKKLISLTHNYLLTIDFFVSKSNTYIDMLKGNKVTVKEFIFLYNILLDDILNILKSKELSYYINSDNSELISSIHHNIFINRAFNKLIITHMEKNELVQYSQSNNDSNTLNIFNELTDELKELVVLIKDIRTSYYIK